jgi:hypothetical protein
MTSSFYYTSGDVRHYVMASGDRTLDGRWVHKFDERFPVGFNNCLTFLLRHFAMMGGVVNATEIGSLRIAGAADA